MSAKLFHILQVIGELNAGLVNAGLGVMGGGTLCAQVLAPRQQVHTAYLEVTHTPCVELGPTVQGALP